MARRRKKDVAPEEVAFKVIVATIFFVFVYRLQGQGVTSIDSLGGLLISSALWVIVPAILICIAYFAIRQANANSGIKPSYLSGISQLSAAYVINIGLYICVSIILVEFSNYQLGVSLYTS